MNKEEITKALIKHKSQEAWESLKRQYPAWKPNKAEKKLFLDGILKGIDIKIEINEELEIGKDRK